MAWAQNIGNIENYEYARLGIGWRYWYSAYCFLSACEKPNHVGEPDSGAPVSEQSLLAAIGGVLDELLESDRFSALFSTLSPTGGDIKPGITVLAPANGAFDKIIVTLATC